MMYLKIVNTKLGVLRYLLFLTIFFSGLTVSEHAKHKEFSADLGDNLMLYRRYIMDTKGAHLKSIRFIMKHNIFIEHLPMHAEMLMQVTKDMRDVFPAGSTSKKSRAKSNIWDRQGDIKKDFISKLDNLYDQAKIFHTLALTDDFNGIKKQAEILTRSCKGCHYLYRGIRLERDERDY
mgnify:FL=1